MPLLPRTGNTRYGRHLVFSFGTEPSKPTSSLGGSQSFFAPPEEELWDEHTVTRSYRERKPFPPNRSNN